MARVLWKWNAPWSLSIQEKNATWLGSSGNEGSKVIKPSRENCTVLTRLVPALPLMLAYHQSAVEDHIMSTLEAGIADFLSMVRPSDKL